MATAHAAAPSPKESTGNELPDLNDPPTIQKMHREAVAEAEALVMLVDELSRAPLTPQNTEAWLKVLDGLEPGPFAQYVVEKIGTAANAGPVRAELLNIQANWESMHAGKVFYKADLHGLADVLRPKNNMPEFANRLLAFVQRLNPFS